MQMTKMSHENKPNDSGCYGNTLTIEYDCESDRKRLKNKEKTAINCVMEPAEL